MIFMSENSKKLKLSQYTHSVTILLLVIDNIKCYNGYVEICNFDEEVF